MKIRQGFVSNSSSSSFLVCFPEYPYSEEKLKDLMFPDKKLDDFIIPADGTYEKLSVKDVVKIVYADKNRPEAHVSFGGIIDFFFNFLPERIEEVEAFNYNGPEGETQEEFDRRLLARNMKVEKLAMEEGYEWYCKHRDAYMYKFEYSDNTGSTGFVMEHGNIFGNLSHLRRCQH